MKIIPVTAAGGVLYTQSEGETQLLLIFRRGVWDLPKGKLEPGESIEECARREVAEEVGCPLPELAAKLITTYHQYRENGETVGKTTHWYAMPAPRADGFVPDKNEGITGLEWYTVEDAAQKVGFENLRSVIASFRRWRNNNAGID